MDGRCLNHAFEASDDMCRSCGHEYCSECLVYSFGPKKPPFCISCALSAAGVRSGAARPKAVSKRELKKHERERKKATKAKEKEGAVEAVAIKPLSIKFDGEEIDATPVVRPVEVEALATKAELEPASAGAVPAAARRQTSARPPEGGSRFTELTGLTGLADNKPQGIDWSGTTEPAAPAAPQAPRFRAPPEATPVVERPAPVELPVPAVDPELATNRDPEPLPPPRSIDWSGGPKGGSTAAPVAKSIDWSGGSTAEPETPVSAATSSPAPTEPMELQAPAARGIDWSGGDTSAPEPARPAPARGIDWSGGDTSAAEPARPAPPPQQPPAPAPARGIDWSGTSEPAAAATPATATPAATEPGPSTEPGSATEEPAPARKPVAAGSGPPFQFDPSMTVVKRSPG